MTWKLGREDIAAGPYQQRIGTPVSSFTGVNASSISTFRDVEQTNAASLARLNVASLSTLRDLQAAAHSSLTGLSVSSNFIGHAAIRGIATMNSGTTVVSVSATGVVSGDVILPGIYMYGDARTYNQSRFIGVAVESVRAGAFEIVATGSVAPIANMPVAWFKVA